MSNDEWLTVEQASELLGLSARQVYRYGKGAHPRIQTRQEGRRTMFYAPDVTTLAQELGAPPPPPKAEIVPPGQFLDFIEEMQRRNEALHRELQEAAAREGYLRGQLDQQRLPVPAQQDLYKQLTEAQARIQELEQQLEATRQATQEATQQQDAPEVQETPSKPWWKFWT